MAALRVCLVLFLLALTGYTGLVVAGHGPNLLPVFFGDMVALTWPGQFNLDFMGFLSLSGLWLAWRHHFTPGGLALGVLGFFGGMAVLAPYLVYASLQARDDPRVLFLGPARASALE